MTATEHRRDKRWFREYGFRTVRVTMHRPQAVRPGELPEAAFRPLMKGMPSKNFLGKLFRLLGAKQ